MAKVRELRTTDPSYSAKTKMQWARLRLDDLQDIRNDYFEGTPYAVVCHEDREKAVYKVYILEDIFIEVPLITGDIIHNLRSALDHMIVSLVRDNGQEPKIDTCFPIIPGRTGEFQHRVRRHVKGVRKEVEHAVFACRPYEGADNPLWTLHQLDVRDKHRVLLTVLGGTQGPKLPDNWTEGYPTPTVPGGMVLPREGLARVHNGKVLFVDSVRKKCQEVGFSFDIALDEPGLVKCEPVVPYLTQLCDFVENLVDSFDHLYR